MDRRARAGPRGYRVNDLRQIGLRDAVRESHPVRGRDARRLDGHHLDDGDPALDEGRRLGAADQPPPKDDGHVRVRLARVPERSLRWFAGLTQLALALVSTGRIHPAVVHEGPFRVARWRPRRRPRPRPR